jgi:interleukin-1 receptor-associated kinase 1
MEPKIGDFGLAREGPQEQYTHVKVSRVHGTRPYLPDEFLRDKKFSTKVDTYSFGIVRFQFLFFLFILPTTSIPSSYTL